MASAFTCTGRSQAFTVPAGVTSLYIQLYGAQGFTYVSGSQGAYGGFVNATLNVTAGETFVVNVGCQGTHTAGGFNGGGGVAAACGPAGGGGGASDIRTGANFSSVVLMAGGGAGFASSSSGSGGSGGATTLLTSTHLTGGTGTVVGSTCGSGGGGGYFGGIGGAGTQGGGGSSYIGSQKFILTAKSVPGVWGGGSGKVIISYYIAL